MNTAAGVNWYKLDRHKVRLREERLGTFSAHGRVQLAMFQDSVESPDEKRKTTATRCENLFQII